MNVLSDYVITTLKSRTRVYRAKVNQGLKRITLTIKPDGTTINSSIAVDPKQSFVRVIYPNGTGRIYEGKTKKFVELSKEAVQRLKDITIPQAVAAFEAMDRMANNIVRQLIQNNNKPFG